MPLPLRVVGSLCQDQLVVGTDLSQHLLPANQIEICNGRNYDIKDQENAFSHLTLNLPQPILQLVILLLKTSDFLGQEESRMRVTHHNSWC